MAAESANMVARQMRNRRIPGHNEKAAYSRELQPPDVRRRSGPPPRRWRTVEGRTARAMRRGCDFGHASPTASTLRP
jgi:hypothetical protein